MFKFLFKPAHIKLVEREIDESNRLLLQAHTNAEHWESQVQYHTKKLQRLKKQWNSLQTGAEKDKLKDTPNG